MFHGTSFASASAAAMMLAMQDSNVDMLCYYDTRLIASAYGGFFAPLTFEPVSTYYAFAAFGELYALGTQAECVFDRREDGTYAIAASDKDRKAVMIVNNSEQERELSMNVGDDMSVYLVDCDHYITRTKLSAKAFTMAPNQIALIKNY